MFAAHWIKINTLKIGLIPTCLSLFIATLSGNSGDFLLSEAESQRMRKETVMAVESVQAYHFSRKPLQSIDSREIITTFMEDLDYNRLFFQKSDEEEMHFRFNDSLQTVYIKQGNLYPAFEMFKRYQQRALERLDWLSAELSQTFDFDLEESYEPDRSEAEWPKGRQEADTLWHKRIKYDLLQELLRDVPLSKAREKVQRRYERTRKHLEEIEPREVQEIFLNTVTSMYDPHTTFLSTDTFKEFDIAIKNALEGIGAILRDEDGYCVIQELIPGGPAESSGKLYPGDKIVEVAQGTGSESIDVVDMKLKKIVKMIRGKKGTTVQLTLLPAEASDVSERRTVSLIRDKIQLTENLAHAELFQVPNKFGETVLIGRIELPSFYGTGIGKKAHASTTDDVEELIGKLKKAKIEGLVLDLRRNGGGLLKEAIKLTGLFIEKGPVVQVKDNTGQVRRDWDHDPKIVYDGPLIVLVSRRSASASEIVAGALQSHRRALIVGDANTHGKGTVQQIYPLRSNRIGFPLRLNPDEFGATKVTIQKFYLPNGKSTQNKGIHSDIVIPSANTFLPIGESDLPRALAWDSIDPIDWNQSDLTQNSRNSIDDTLFNNLRSQSLKRLESLEEFTYLKRNIDWMRKKQDEKEISLNITQRREQKQKDKAFKETMKTLRKSLSENRYPREEVLLNISQQHRNEQQQKLKYSRLPNGKYKANQYYANTFYYQPEDDSEIKAIRIESFDYETIAQHSKELSSFLSKKTEVSLDPDHLEDLFTQLKNGEQSDDFQLEKLLQKQYKGILSEQQISTVLPDFLGQLILLDPEVIDDRLPFDIAMRESLRILIDWIN